jgi:hypothetical protein
MPTKSKSIATLKALSLLIFLLGPGEFGVVLIALYYGGIHAIGLDTAIICISATIFGFVASYGIWNLKPWSPIALLVFSVVWLGGAIFNQVSSHIDTTNGFLMNMAIDFVVLTLIFLALTTQMKKSRTE